MVAETSTLPYAVRLVEPGKIRVFLKLKAGIFLSALPAKHTDFIIEKIRDVYPSIRAAKNILQTSLQNGNPVIHPAITLLNAGLIERTGGDFYFYQEGVTRAAGRLIKAVDEERIAIGKKLNVEVLPDPVIGYEQGYMAEPTYDIGYSKAPGFQDIKAPPSLDDRYLNEDVGYGLVFMKSLADQFHIDTPAIDTVIQLASVLMSRDYLSEGKRTMVSLGLSEYNAEELESLVT
jgi:opine dehydrogenase